MIEPRMNANEHEYFIPGMVVFRNAQRIFWRLWQKWLVFDSREFA
jgi:hypothetical protein